MLTRVLQCTRDPRAPTYAEVPSESRSISAHGSDEALPRACRHPCLCRYPLGRSSNHGHHKLTHAHLSRGPKKDLATAIEGCITHGVCCRVRPLISCCGPQTQESECPWPPSACVCWFYPGALLSPLSPHPCPCPSPCPCPHPHRTHILPLLFSCVGVGVGDGVLVDSPCQSASPLPCCPAACTAPCSAVRDWTAHPVCPPSSPRQKTWLADGTSAPLQACNPIASFSIRKALRQATINKPVGSISRSPAQPSSLAPVYLHPRLPYHK